MKNRTLTTFISLVSIMCALTACGSSGSSGSSATTAVTLAKDATVTISFDPGNTGGKAYKISPSTNYIQLYVTQWQAGDLNVLNVINQDTQTLTAGNPSATLTLYPTYTRICASQYSSTPSNTAAPIEASCSFGILNAGNNTVTLTMLNDQWTLSQSYSSYGFGSLVLSYPNTTTASSGSVSYGVYDGNINTNYGLFNHLPAQSINGLGSAYQLQVKDSSGNIISFPAGSGEGAFATTFFNYGDNGPSFAGIVKVIGATGKTTITIGGFGRGVDSDGFISETKNVIVYPPSSNIPVITYPTSSFQIMDNKGNNVTSTVFANCELQVLSGSSIQGCGITNIKNSDGTDNSSSDIQKGTPTNYNYMVTSTASVVGADICYTNNAGAARNSGGNIICYDYDMITSPSGSISCPSGGTYNNSRCEYTLSTTCTNNIQSNNQNTSNKNTYNATSQSCTATGVSYYLNLNSTALTLTAN